VQRSALVAGAALVAACWVAGAPARGGQPLAFPQASPELVERLVGAGLPQEPLELALRAFACGRARGEFSEPILTLLDYSRPSTERRLWVLDLETGEVLFHELVAHGRESGVRRANAFSNAPGSKRSSIGLFRTAEAYQGRHGYSLRLDGLERGVNDRARERAIVVHSAGYASEDFASRHGRLGRSWGCPVLDPAVHRRVIDAIRGGTALFAYYPDADWLSASSFLECREGAVGAAHRPRGER
jgi:hypothetical protein